MPFSHCAFNVVCYTETDCKLIPHWRWRNSGYKDEMRVKQTEFELIDNKTSFSWTRLILANLSAVYSNECSCHCECRHDSLISKRQTHKLTFSSFQILRPGCCPCRGLIILYVHLCIFIHMYLYLTISSVAIFSLCI